MASDGYGSQPSYGIKPITATMISRTLLVSTISGNHGDNFGGLVHGTLNCCDVFSWKISQVINEQFIARE